MHLAIGSLLLIGLHILGTASSPTIKSNSDLSRINMMRREAGKLKGIKVPDLVYDENLAAQAASLEGVKCRIDPGPDSRYFPDSPSDEDSLKFLNIMTGIILRAAQPKGFDVSDELYAAIKSENEQMEKHLKTHSLFTFELYNPEQTRIGCALRTCSTEIGDEFKSKLRRANLPPNFQLNNKRIQFDAICILGKTNKFNLDSKKKMAEGLLAYEKDMMAQNGVTTENERVMTTGNEPEIPRGGSPNARKLPSSASTKASDSEESLAITSGAIFPLLITLITGLFLL